ncbi:Eco57I restriction-modification methylase domain-containing protein [Hallella multisaccharivorax]|uniref:Eco57I restriction-modification methylase domain-containing protein n=1 Tax=Hallella multisaccharivorax TaxID=310514 RepID=UPI0036237A83
MIAEIKYYKNLIENITHTPAVVVNAFKDGKRFWGINNDENMTIDAIIGNPPYQLTVAKKDTDNGQKRVSSIFHHFQILADKIARYTSLIYPGGRWIHRSGKGLASFGMEQINDPHLAKIVFYPDANELFSQQGIPDGISIVMKDMRKKSQGFRYIYSLDGTRIEVDSPNPGEELMPLNPLDVDIVSKINEVVSERSLEYLHDSVLSQKLFGIESDFVEVHPDLVREYVIDSDVDFTKEIKLFTNDKAGKSGRARWYVTEKKNITSGTQYLDKWKVVVSSANAGGQKRSNQLAVLDNHSAFGRARVALKVFGTETEARNFYKYVKSELIRFAFLMTDESLTSLAKQVPDLQDYSNDNPYLDFSGNINTQLYDLFHIDHQTQQYIRDVLAKKAE